MLTAEAKLGADDAVGVTIVVDSHVSSISDCSFVSFVSLFVFDFSFSDCYFPFVSQGYFLLAVFNVLVTVSTVAVIFIFFCCVHRCVGRSTRHPPPLPDTPTSFIEMFTPPPPAAAVASVVDASVDGDDGPDDRRLDIFDGLDLEETIELQTPPPPRTPRRSSRPTKGIAPARLDISFSSF